MTNMTDIYGKPWWWWLAALLVIGGLLWLGKEFAEAIAKKVD